MKHFIYASGLLLASLAATPAFGQMTAKSFPKFGGKAFFIGYDGSPSDTTGD